MKRVAGLALAMAAVVVALTPTAGADTYVSHGYRSDVGLVVNCNGVEDIIQGTVQYLVQNRFVVDGADGQHTTVIRIITQGFTGVSTLTGGHYAVPGTQFGLMNLQPDYEGVVKAEGFSQVAGGGEGLVWKMRFSITSVYTNGESHVSINEWTAECV